MQRFFTRFLSVLCICWFPFSGHAQVVVGSSEGGGELPPSGGTLVIGGYPYVSLTPSTPDQSYYYNGSYPAPSGSVPWNVSGGGQITYQDQDRVDVHWTTGGIYQVSYTPTVRNTGELNTLDVEVTCAPVGGDKPDKPIVLGAIDPVGCARTIAVADVSFLPGACGGYVNDFGGPGIDIFYQFTLAKPADVEIATCRSDFDATLTLQWLRPGTTNTYEDVVFNDDNGSSCMSQQASVNVPLEPGTYRFVVEGYSATNYGSLGIDLIARRPEMRLVVPPSAEVAPSGSVVLTVSGADTYSWTPTTGLSSSSTTWATVTAAPTQTTTYTVTGTACNGERQADKQITVYVMPENRNYVTTHTVLNYFAGTSIINADGGTVLDANADVRNEANLWGRPVRELAQSTEFFDDLGRPLQAVAKQASPLGKDIVVPMQYDAFGRMPRVYLPYADQRTGLFKTDALGASGKQAQFYQAASDRVVNDPMPYTTALYEPSPLGRVLEQGAPGETWQAGTSHSVKVKQRPNTAADAVRQWTYSFSGQSYSSNGTYGAGQLWVKQTLDEQDQLVNEYVDGLGRTILKRVSLAQTACDVKAASAVITLNAPTGMVITGIRTATWGRVLSGSTCNDISFDLDHRTDATAYVQAIVASSLGNGSIAFTVDPAILGPDPDPTGPSSSKSLQVVATYAPATNAPTDQLTYYVYDDFNNLRLVISPEGYNALLAAGSWGINSTDAFVRNWCFQYNYDERQRVITKLVPGANAVSLVYNQRNQVVLTQDGNQAADAATKNWTFTKYDDLGRPIISGTVSRPSDTRASLQTAMDAETVATESTTGSSLEYTNNAYPRNITTNDVLSYSYYDRYDYAGLSSSALAPTVSSTQRSLRVRGLLTGTNTRQLSATAIVALLGSAVYYDEKNRVLQTVATNHLSGTDRLTNTLTFAGMTTATALVHTANGATHTVLNRYVFDATGRPTTTYQTLDSQPQIILSHKSYNELGEMISKRLHSTSASPTNAQFLQKVDYRYNIRGWLTNINDRDLTNGATVEGQDPDPDTNADPDLFGLEIRYNTMLQDPATPQYADGAKPQYNGNIAQVMWQTRPVNSTNNKLRLYNYHYDPANRITDAPYARYDGAWVNNSNRPAGAQDFSASNITYDGNGNLRSMTRQGAVNGSNSNPVYGTLDQLTYYYSPAAGNQLQAVNDGATSGTSTHDFKGTAASGQVKYNYDANGNLISDANKYISGITYNLLNQPVAIYQAYNRIEYTYTATGTKLQKRTYRYGQLLTTTDYAGPFVYEQNAPAFVQTAEGRALYTTSGTYPWKYEYHLKDHLGNLRFAFRADRDGGTDTQLQAGMEPSNAATEEKQFAHVAETRLADPTHARTGDYVAKLNAYTGRRDGPAIRLKVAAGDSVRAEVYGRYDRGSGVGTWLQRGAVVAGAVAAGSSGDFGTDQTLPGAPRRRRQPFFGLCLAVVPQLLKAAPAEIPTAYLRYELFTRDSQLVATHIQPILRTANDEWQRLRVGTKADSTGFARISLVNESGRPAYFDDLTVNTVAPSPYQENHYDPFGLNLVGIEMADTPNSSFQYNGKEKQEDFGLNWLDYGARMFDVQIGRWHTIDPIASNYYEQSPYSYVANNPVNLIDIGGKEIGIYDQALGKTITYTPGMSYNGNPFVVNTVASLNRVYNGGGANAKAMILAVSSDKSFSVDIYKTDKIGATVFEGDLINYNDFEGLITSNGGRMSPSIGLFHEISHAYRFMMALQKLDAANARGNKEEIALAKKELTRLKSQDLKTNDEEEATRNEAEVANNLGEGSRRFYKDFKGPFITNGPLSTEDGKPSQDEQKQINKFWEAQREYFRTHPELFK
jgi:RHS repeat-associated protein